MSDLALPDGVEVFDLFAKGFHDGAGLGGDAVRMILAQVVVTGQRLAGEGVQEGFAEQLAVGRMTQVVHLATGALIGQHLQHLERDRDGNLLDLFALLAVLRIGADVVAVPLCTHVPPVVVWP